MRSKRARCAFRAAACRGEENDEAQAGQRGGGRFGDDDGLDPVLARGDAGGVEAGRTDAPRG